MSSNSRSSRSRKRQARLQFLPLSSSSPAKEPYSTSVQDRLASVRYEGARSTPLTSSQNAADLNDTPLSTPVPSSLPLNQSPSAISSPLARLNRSRDASAKEPDLTNTRTETTDEDEVVYPSSKKRRVQISHLSDRGEVDTPVRFRRTLQRVTPRPSSRERAVEDLGSAESSEDDAGFVLTRSVRTARNRLQPRSHTKSSAVRQDEFIVDDDEIEYISSDPEPSPRRRAERTRRRVRRSRAEQDEIEDDLADLQDSDGELEVEDNRTRGGPVQTQRDRAREHLEALKRRRAGEKIRKVTDTDEDDELVQDAAGHVYEQDDGAEIDQIGIEQFEPLEPETSDNEDDGLVCDEEASARPVDSLRFGEEVGDDEFVVSDDEPADGIESESGLRSGIPLAFTSFASRRPRELFVYVVEWLVKNKIAPAFIREDEIYLLSWNKINDQLKAQAGSRLISAAWNEDFKNTILARPQMEFHHAGQDCENLSLNCDACKRTNHPAVYRFTFSGHTYHKDTLEPIDEDVDDQDREGNLTGSAKDEDSEHASYDQAGRLLPSSRTVFNLGRFCAANAEMGHKLTHWKYNLNASLLDYLEEQGVLSAQAIVARDKLSKKKREKEAENIVDLMEETGVINEMWSSLQSDLENARHGMEDHRIEHQGGQPIRSKTRHKGGRLKTDRTRITVESGSD